MISWIQYRTDCLYDVFYKISHHHAILWIPRIPRIQELPGTAADNSSRKNCRQQQTAAGRNPIP